MGFLDSLFGKNKCRYCGAKGAKEIDGRVHCPNPQCGCYDPDLATRREEKRPAGKRTVPSGTFAAKRPVAIRYRNFRGEDCNFTGETDTLRRKGNHISVCVEPTGSRVTLARNRIQNLEEVESALPRTAAGAPATIPTPRERQVLAYHKKYKSTSPLYEQIRAKYPDW